MNAKYVDRLTLFLRCALGVSAAAYLAVYILIACYRIRSPFEIEWFEGTLVDHVQRILNGESLYVAPSLKFVPCMYTPFYYFVAAVVAKLTGIGFFPLRFVSFIASLGCFAAIFLIVRQRAASLFPCFIAAGLSAATFRIGGGWFDVARIDSLFLFCFLAAVLLLSYEPSPRRYILAGCFISLSILTKQTALMMSAPLIVYCFFASRRCFLFLLGAILLALGGSSVVLNYLSGGWYLYYVYTLPTYQTYTPDLFLQFWRYDLASHLSIALLASVAFLCYKLLKAARKDGFFWFTMFIGMVGCAWISRVHNGGYDNVLMPAYAAICILFGMSVDLFPRLLQSKPGVGRSIFKAVFYLACLVQFEQLIYRPQDQLPTAADARAGQQFIEAVSQINGEVFMPSHGYLPVLAGKQTYANEMNLFDVLRGTESEKEAMKKELTDAIRNQRFSAIILDSPTSDHWLALPEFDRYYIKQQSLLEDSPAFFPVTGLRTRPDTIYVPRNIPRE